jgi:subtilisin family serine protease
MPLKIFGQQMSLVAAAITFAAQGGAGVISMSFEDPSLDGDGTPNDVVGGAIDDAVYKQGVVICASSGNDNSPTFHYPASHPRVLACGACNPSGNRCTPADWGNNQGSNYGSPLSVVAPGVDITSTDLTGEMGYTEGDYVLNFWGTSAAAPQVAALAVLIIHNFPVFNQQPFAIRAIIESTADKVGTVTVTADASGNPVQLGAPLSYQLTAGKPNGTWNWETGYGQINLMNALAQAQAMSSSGAVGSPPPVPQGVTVQ